MNKTEIENIESLNSVVKTLNSSIEFYNDARKAVDNILLKNIFDDIAVAHKSCVEILQPYIRINDGQHEDGSSVQIQLRKLYTHTIAKMKSRNDDVFITQLEEVEDKLLNECERAMQKELPEVCKAALYEVKRSLEQSHNLMRELQTQ